MHFVMLLGQAPGPEAQRLDAAKIPWRHLDLIGYRPSGAAPPPGPRPAHVLVTSARAFDHTPAEVFEGARLHVVGSQTARAAEARGLAVEVVGTLGGEALVAAVREHLAPGERAWLVGAERLAPATTRALADWAAEVSHWGVYGSEVVPDAREALASMGRARLVLLTSPRYAAAFLQAGGQADGAVVIGPTTRDAAEALGLRVVGMAQSPSRALLGDAAVAAWEGLEALKARPDPSRRGCG